MERNGSSTQKQSNKGHTLRRSLAVVGDDDGVSTSSANASAAKDESAESENLLTFIKETLNKNIKDRNLILRTESELLQFINTHSKSLPLPGPYSSYQRLLIHRVAAYFGLEHNIDNSGSGILISRGEKEPLPEANRIKFRDLITTNLSQEHTESAKQKQRKTNHTRSQVPTAWTNPQQRILKVASFDATPEGRAPPHVAKAFSFGGYARHTTHKIPNTLSLETSLSPASSGYKSTSFPSMELRTPSPAGPYSYSLPGEEPSPASQDAPPQSLHAHPPPVAHSTPNRSPASSQQELVLWAVSDIKTVPPGAVLIDPMTFSPLRYGGQEEGQFYVQPPVHHPQQPATPYYSPHSQYNYYEQLPDWLAGISLNSASNTSQAPPPSYHQQYYQYSPPQHSLPHTQPQSESHFPGMYFPSPPHPFTYYPPPPSRTHAAPLTGPPLRFFLPQQQQYPVLLQPNHQYPQQQQHHQPLFSQDYNNSGLPRGGGQGGRGYQNQPIRHKHHEHHRQN